MNSVSDSVAGVVLAGGLSRRMGGGDKTLLSVAGAPMLSRVIDRLKPQVGSLVLNANGDPARFAAYGLTVVADPIEGFAGPLAGVLAGLRWGKENTGARYIVSVAGDTPFFPRDLVSRLLEAADGKDRIVLASSNGRAHPVIGLWPVSLADDLDAFLTAGETRKVLVWVDRHDNTTVDFPMLETGTEPLDPFFNINTPEEISVAEQLAVAGV